MHWYLQHNHELNSHARTPRCLDAFEADDEMFLLLEDLATSGFEHTLSSVSWEACVAVLHWLAHFHAQHLNVKNLSPKSDALWPQGTYWHLETRPDELAMIEGTRVHLFASLLDARLRGDAFPTLVHGDAKLANFCFSTDHQSVAAVDFQYVGHGAAMSDVAYFIGSCFGEEECQRREASVLDTYFSFVCECLPPELDVVALEAEWRKLYPIAWADFHRFMMGWNPEHPKLTPYSDSMVERAITQVTDELSQLAREAAISAGRFIRASQDRAFEVKSKGFANQASDLVTTVDLLAQDMLLSVITPTLDQYDLGLLAEEGSSDDSRLHKHAYWAIDPLDGTRYFVEGGSGYATSIALVSRSGQALLGVVYDPVNDLLYEAVRGRGVTLNGERLRSLPPDQEGPIQWFADRSLIDHPSFEVYQDRFQVHFMGGAVVNSLQLLTQPNSCYLKAPKPTQGGCAIWDLAAVSLMLEELGGSACFYDGSPLLLNRPQSVFFNDVGVILTSPHLEVDTLKTQLSAEGAP